MKSQLESAPHNLHLGIRSTDGKIHKAKHHKEEENEEIKAYLTKLQEIVPFMPKHKKLSKLEVITCVIDYIRDLRSTLGLPLNSARVPLIPSSLDSSSSSDELDMSPLDHHPLSHGPMSPSASSLNNNVSSVVNYHLSSRTPLSQISTPNNINSSLSCGSQEF